MAGPFLGALNGVWFGSYLTLRATESIDPTWDLVPFVLFALGGLISGGWLAMQIQGLDELIAEKDETGQAQSRPVDCDEYLPDAPYCPYACSCAETGRCGSQPLCRVLKVMGVHALKLTTTQPKYCHYRVSLDGAEICSCPRRYALHLNTGS